MSKKRPTRRITRRRRKQKGGSERHTVVLIEGRKPKSLPIVIRSIFENLDGSWDLMLFHSTENESWMRGIVEEQFPGHKGRITMKMIPGRPSNIDIDYYNSLMMTRESILDEIPTEMFMMMQTDSILCRGKGHILKDFMKYDYVGAPWSHSEHTGNVGNGGLSLRRKSKMLEILEKCPKGQHQEDGFFSSGCDLVKPYKPSAEEAGRFSIESIYGPESFGVHKPWLHIIDLEPALCKQCGGYEELSYLHWQRDD
jgi:hypothetical protein